MENNTKSAQVKFEYKVESILLTGFNDEIAIESTCNKLGEDGWELVNGYLNESAGILKNRHYTLIFKRRVY